MALGTFEVLALGLDEADMLLLLRALRAVDSLLVVPFLEIVESLDVVSFNIIIFGGGGLLPLEEIAYSQEYPSGAKVSSSNINPSQYHA